MTEPMSMPDRLTDEETREAIFSALHEVLACDPMWIGDDGEPLDYLPEREVLIGDAVERQTDAVLSALAARLAAQPPAEPHGLESHAGPRGPVCVCGAAWDPRDETCVGRRPVPPAQPPATDRDACHCEPCPGRGTDGHGMEHCAECCFGTGVIAEIDCPVHGDPAACPAPDTLADRVQALALLAGRSDASPEGGA